MNANEDFFDVAHPIYRLQYTMEGSQCPREIEDDDDGPSIYCVYFSPSGQSIASGSGEGMIEVWDADGKLESELVFVVHDDDDDSWSGVIRGLDWSKDGSHLLSTCHSLKIWNVNTGKCVKTLIRADEYDSSVQSAKFSPDDGLILSGSVDGTARMWDAKSGVCLKILTGYDDIVTAVDFHADGTRFMTTSWKGCCYVHDLRSMDIVENLTTEDRPPESAKFCPDSRYILFSMQDNSLRLYDMRNQKVVGIYKGHKNYRFICSNFLLTTSGKYIVSGSLDKLVYIWDVNTQEIVQVLEGHSGHVAGVACHPENDIIASVSWDNSIKIWKCS